MIRRPMLYVACGTAAAVLFSYCAGSLPAAAVAVLIAAALCFNSKGHSSCNQWSDRQRRIALIVLVFYCLGAAAFWQESRTLTEEARQLSGDRLEGEIIDCSEKVSQGGDPFLQLTIRSAQGRVLANVYDPPEEDITEGCMARITGNLQDPAGQRNPGCFDYALYLRTIGITKTMTCDSLTVDPVRAFREDPAAYLRYHVCKTRERFLARLAEETDPSTGSMMRAILFGDKGGLDAETLETFQKNGTAHILAVSGLHIGIIYGFILKLWRWRRGWIFFGSNLVFFVLYAAAAGFSPSVTRAVVMVLLHILAGIRGWRYDLSNGAFAVGIAVLLQNPYMLFNTGFQMSFLAVLTLVLVLPYLKRLYSGLFLASLAVQIGLGPYILYEFNYLSLLAVLINVPVVALAGLIVPAGLTAMALDGAPGSGWLFKSVRLLCEALQKLNDAGQMDSVTTFQIPSPPLWMLAAYYLILLLFASEEGRLALIRAGKKGRYVLKMLLIIAVVSAGFHAFATDGFDGCDMTFVDVGQGDCMHLRIDDHSRLVGRNDRFHVLIDGGGRDTFDVGKKILRPYLLKNGVGTVDLAIVTHLHNDHYDGIRSLCQMGMVKNLLVYEGYKTEEKRILEECGIDRKHLMYAAFGDVITLGDASFTILAPPSLTDREYEQLAADETDENKKSLLIKAEYHRVSAMMTGDIGEEGEQSAMERTSASDMQCTILKVGHHGSITSSCDAFLDAVRPEIAVIQVGEHNLYGHPSEEVLERLNSRGIPIFRNDQQGAVGIELRRGSVKSVRTMLRQGPN